MKNTNKIKFLILIIILTIFIGVCIKLFFCNNVISNKQKQIIKEMNESEYDSQITELNKSHEDYAIQVQKNKQKIAEAITNQKVTTSENATVDEMVANIGKIFETRTSDATATTSDILNGKTAYNNGTLLTGTMENKGELNWAPSEATTYTIEPGYYSGGTLNTTNAYNTGSALVKQPSVKTASSSYGAVTESITIDKDCDYCYVFIVTSCEESGPNISKIQLTNATLDSTIISTTKRGSKYSYIAYTLIKLKDVSAGAVVQWYRYGNASVAVVTY